MFRQTKESVRCPVCDEEIGQRWIQDGCAAYCTECKFTHYYKAYESRPHKSMKGTILESAKPHYCGPGGCHCR